MKYLKVLYVQVIIGLTAGIVTGWFFPSFAPTAKLISEGFINMIKMVITPVIFLTVVLGITGAGSLKKVGRVGGKGLLYFEVVTTFALILGLVVANVIKPGTGIATNRLPNENLDKYTNAAKEMNWGEFFRISFPPISWILLPKAIFTGTFLAYSVLPLPNGNGRRKLISVFENLNKAF